MKILHYCLCMSHVLKLNLTNMIVFPVHDYFANKKLDFSDTFLTLLSLDKSFFFFF